MPFVRTYVVLQYHNAIGWCKYLLDRYKTARRGKWYNYTVTHVGQSIRYVKTSRKYN